MQCKLNEKYTIETLNKSIVLLKENEIYRLMDSLKQKMQHKINIEILLNDKYDGSIARDYLIKYKMTNFYKNHENEHNSDFVKKYKYAIMFKSLMNYIDKNKMSKNLKTFGNDYLVVHLRLGDLYLKFKEQMKSILTNIKNHLDLYRDIKYIVIVTAFHFGQPQVKNFYSPGQYTFSENKLNENLKLLYHFISQLPLPVQLESSNDIDYDFCLLSTAEHLITSFGGFSQLVEIMNNKYKNNRFVSNQL